MICQIIYASPSMAGENILSITYGIDVQPANDPYINLAEKAVFSLVTAAVPGAFLVDSIPFCACFS